VGRLTALPGEIWLIDLGMVQKTRPVLILSIAYKDEERALVSYVVRITSTRGTEYEVPHQAPKFLPGAFAFSRWAPCLMCN
jgi:mRNA-degrading endonuclease toxin of MazEF toxin-antitoxin module